MSLYDLSLSADGFRGIARLFPLPNLVMFPHVMQPLRIFEPRYREMLADALAGDQMIALAILPAGAEHEYAGRPPLRPVACLCRIATSQLQDDGTSNILILGLRRIELRRELPPTRLFREAEVAIIEDVSLPESESERPELQKKLVAAFKQALPSLAVAEQQLDQLLSSQIGLGMLTDIVAYILKLDLALKEQLLGEPDIDRRARLLIRELTKDDGAGDKATWPPDFSRN